MLPTVGKKRALSQATAPKQSTNDDKNTVCAFCRQAPAAVMVTMPPSNVARNLRKPPEPTPFCWLHYYTTRAVRVEENVTILEQDSIPDEVQTLFAEAYTELQQELLQESARAFSTQHQDPLVILRELRGKRKKPPPPPPLNNVTKGDDNAGGGFLRPVPLPERFLQHQEVNPYQRRKPSRQSIWNLAMEPRILSEAPPTTASHHSTSTITCDSCGSTNVTIAGNVTSRNSDMTKGETWGFKDRSEAIVTRYQCEKCGKVWNEEE